MADPAEDIGDGADANAGIAAQPPGDEVVAVAAPEVGEAEAGVVPVSAEGEGASAPEVQGGEGQAHSGGEGASESANRDEGNGDADTSRVIQGDVVVPAAAEAEGGVGVAPSGDPPTDAAPAAAAAPPPPPPAEDKNDVQEAAPPSAESGELLSAASESVMPASDSGTTPTTAAAVGALPPIESPRSRKRIDSQPGEAAARSPVSKDAGDPLPPVGMPLPKASLSPSRPAQLANGTGASHRPDPAKELAKVSCHAAAMVGDLENLQRLINAQTREDKVRARHSPPHKVPRASRDAQPCAWQGRVPPLLSPLALRCRKNQPRNGEGFTRNCSRMLILWKCWGKGKPHRNTRRH